jgi:ABC-type branched-subunit amino acid transport system ATPase component
VLVEAIMSGMTVEEARNSFDRLLEMAKHGSVVLRDGEHEVAIVMSMSEYAVCRRWLAIQARNELAADAAANGLTEEILSEILTGNLESKR